MKNSLLIFFYILFTSSIVGQVTFPLRDNFTHGISIGVSQVKYLYKLSVGIGDERRSIFSEINNTNSFDWNIAYNLEYKINKRFSVRSQLDFSRHETTLTLKEFSGTVRQYNFGSFDVGVPLHLMYRVGNKKWHPIVFMGFKTALLSEVGKDYKYINLSTFETGLEAGIGGEFNFSKCIIRQELSLYNGLTYWLNDEYIYTKRIFYGMSRDYISFRLVFMQRKGS
jgi:Outer membrane protein beta-barrel domain